MTKKEKRAKERIQRAKHKKNARLTNFLIRLARRRMKDPGSRLRVDVNFCCRPDSLGMPRADLMAKGQQLIGGDAAFFDRGELRALITSRWDCQNRERAIVLLKSYIEENYSEDGSYRDPYYDAGRDNWI